MLCAAFARRPHAAAGAANVIEAMPVYCNFRLWTVRTLVRVLRVHNDGPVVLVAFTRSRMHAKLFSPAR